MVTMSQIELPFFSFPLRRLPRETIVINQHQIHSSRALKSSACVETMLVCWPRRRFIEGVRCHWLTSHLSFSSSKKSPGWLSTPNEKIGPGAVGLSAGRAETQSNSSIASTL